MKPQSRLSQVLKVLTHLPQSAIRLSDTSEEGYFGINEKYKIGIANDLDTRRQAYMLLYKVYMEKEFATPDPSKMWYSKFDANPMTTTVIVQKGKQVVAALTLVFDSPDGLPAEEAYSEEIKAMKSSGMILSEIMSFGIINDLRNSQEILIKLFNYAYLIAGGIYGASDFIITVNPRHVIFYKRKLLFSVVGLERDYQKVGGAPALLLSRSLSIVNTERREGFSKSLYRGFFPLSQEAGMLRYIKNSISPMTEFEQKYFFTQMRQININNHQVHLMGR